jgi:pimeloyl-ACP methyl ester carboxylesterase
MQNPFDTPTTKRAFWVVTGSGLQSKALRTYRIPGRPRLAASLALLISSMVSLATPANGLQPVCGDGRSDLTFPLTHVGLPNLDENNSCLPTERISGSGDVSPVVPRLIVIGFMGGRVKGGNLVHREALLAKELQEGYPHRVYASVFANHDAQSAMKMVLHLLDENLDGRLSAEEKSAARIVIYGHSWGASETVAFAARLNALNIPVLLTVQVDSVRKPHEDDEDIPPNVREAINFYQTEGLLHGRSLIEAIDPKRTTILGNYESSYKRNPVACTKYPWLARVFMKPHIEIENDPSVWGKIAALIRTKFL